MIDLPPPRLRVLTRPADLITEPLPYAFFGSVR